MCVEINRSGWKCTYFHDAFMLCHHSLINWIAWEEWICTHGIMTQTLAFSWRPNVGIYFRLFFYE